MVPAVMPPAARRRKPTARARILKHAVLFLEFDDDEQQGVSTLAPPVKVALFPPPPDYPLFVVVFNKCFFQMMRCRSKYIERSLTKLKNAPLL